MSSPQGTANRTILSPNRNTRFQNNPIPSAHTHGSNESRKQGNQVDYFPNSIIQQNSVSNDNKSFFVEWLQEYESILSILHTNQPQPEIVDALLKHLLQIFTNNASLKISELTRLKLPMSPFQYHSSNFYLRVSTLQLTDLPLRLVFEGKFRDFFEIVEPNFKEILEKFYPEKIINLSDTICKLGTALAETLKIKNIKEYRTIANNFYQDLYEIHCSHLMWIDKIDNSIIMNEFFDILNSKIIENLRLNKDYKRLEKSIKKNFEMELINLKKDKLHQNIPWIGICSNHEIISKHLIVSNRKLNDQELKNKYHIYIRKALNKSGYWPDKRSIFSIITKWISKKRKENGELKNILKRIIQETQKLTSLHNTDKSLEDLVTRMSAVQIIAYDNKVTSEFPMIPSNIPEHNKPFFKIIEKIIIKTNDNNEFNKINSEIFNYIQEKIKIALRGCLESLNNSVEFTNFFRYFLELSITYFTFLEKKENEIPSTIQKIFPEDKKRIQNIRLTNYAMQSVTQILSAATFQKKKLIIGTLIQNYFEIPESMRKMNYETRQYKLLSEIDDDVDILFADFHPNNAAENELRQNQIEKWLEKFMKSEAKTLTLALDITLNALTDKEIKSLVQNARKFIDSGKLNLVLFQSLTKLAQLGADVLSAGIDISFNNPEYWQTFNSYLIKKTPEMSTEYYHFFNVLLSCQKAQLEYISILRNNTSFLHEQLSEYLDQVPTTQEQRAMDINLNSDSGSCYISINFSNFLGKFFRNENKEAIKNKKNIVKTILNKLIEPLLATYKLPITFRQSIGMSLTTLDQCEYNLRLKVGIENDFTINEYALLFAQICAILSVFMNQKENLIIKEFETYIDYTVKILSNENSWTIYKNFSIHNTRNEYIDIYFHPQEGFHCLLKNRTSGDKHFSFLKRIPEEIKDKLSQEIMLSMEDDFSFIGVNWNEFRPGSNEFIEGNEGRIRSLIMVDGHKDIHTEKTEYEYKIYRKNEPLKSKHYKIIKATPKIYLTMLLCRLYYKDDLVFFHKNKVIEMTGFTRMECDFESGNIELDSNKGKILGQVTRDTNTYSFAFWLENEDEQFDGEDVFLKFPNHEPIPLLKYTAKNNLYASLVGETLKAEVGENQLILIFNQELN